MTMINELMKASLVSVGGELRAADHLDCDGLEGHLELLGVLAGAVVQHVVHQVDQVQLRGEGGALLCHPGDESTHSYSL